MSYIKIGNKIITTPIKTILQQINKESNNRFFKDIKDKGNQLCITCPSHKQGQENNPSCFITDNFSDDMNGVWHCFTCGASGTLLDLVAYCFDDIVTASEWLTERFADTLVVQEILLPEIKLEKDKKEYLDESILQEYSYFHPYMFKRGLTEEIIRKFKVGCTPDGKYITFPCWDEHSHLVGIFKRSTEGKHFIIPKNIDKPIYLLNFIKDENITTVYVTESQFNALTCWSWGYPAIALFGTGTKEQYEILKRSGIRHFILCFDGDIAGDAGIKRFINNMPDDIMISVKYIPRDKDVNDLTKEEFDSLEIS